MQETAAPNSILSRLAVRLVWAANRRVFSLINNLIPMGQVIVEAEAWAGQ